VARRAAGLPRRPARPGLSDRLAGRQGGRDRCPARDDAPPPERLAAALFAQLQSGLLLLPRTEQALWPLEAALDGALVQLRAALASAG